LTNGHVLRFAVVLDLREDGMGDKSPIAANDEQRAALASLAGSRDRGEADRARAVLLTLSGWTSPMIAEAFGVREDTVRLWRSDFGKGAIEVNAAPLLGQCGNPTAGWLQQNLPGTPAQELAAHMAPGGPNAATLNVRISSVYLGGGGPADPDSMRGVAAMSGGASRARTVRLRTTSIYTRSPTDQALPERARQGRVSALSQGLRTLACAKNVALKAHRPDMYGGRLISRFCAWRDNRRDLAGGHP
jgi:hypothetical protein